MFEQSILVRQRTSKPWSVLLSLAAELAGIGLLVVLPLIWAERLPAFGLTKIAVWLAPVQTPAPVRPVPAGPHTKPSPFDHRGFIAPPSAPGPIKLVGDPPAAPWGVDTLARSGPPNGIARPDLLVRVSRPPEPPVATRTAGATPPAPPVRIRVSQIEPARILYKVMPVYPRMALITRTSGTVHLLGVIGADGSIQSLRVIGGHALLVGAAVDAVRQWRYKPTVLNGQAVEVEAPIDVTFTLR